MSDLARNHRLDLLRVIALMMIVLMHSPMPDSAPGFVLSGISYLTAPGIGLFFMISGALLLDNNLSTKDFLNKRFTKILFPTLFWSVFYLIIKCCGGQMTNISVFKSVFSIPFSAQGHGIIWFMYTLAGLYLLAPILSQWLKQASKREVEFYLLLWAMTLLYPYLSKFLIVNENETGVLYYFSGYLGYFLLGYYLTRHYRFRIIHPLLAIGVVIIVPMTLYCSGIEVDFYTMLWYLSMPVALMAFCWFVLINRCPNRKIVVINEISKLSFGIYFIHIFIMRNILWKINMITALPGILQIFVVMILTIFFSFIAVWLISRFPHSKYIIGV